MAAQETATPAALAGQEDSAAAAVPEAAAAAPAGVVVDVPIHEGVNPELQRWCDEVAGATKQQQADSEQQWQLLFGCQHQQWQHDQQQQQPFGMIDTLLQQVWQLEQHMAGLAAQVAGSVTAEQVQQMVHGRGHTRMDTRCRARLQELDTRCGLC